MAMYDDKDFINITNIFNRYIKFKENNISPNFVRSHKSYLKSFIRYLESSNVRLEEACYNNFEKYLDWIIDYNHRINLNFTLSWFKNHLHYLIIFIKWVQKEKICNIQNSFKHQVEILNLIEKKITLKRINNQDQNLSDKKLIEKYKDVLGQKNVITEINRTIKLIEKLKDFANDINKVLLELTSKDYEEFRFQILKYHRFASISPSKHTIKRNLTIIKMFHLWLFNQGYIKDFYLKDWTEKKLLAFAETNKSRPPEKRFRYYNHSEIIRAYKKYLNKNYKNYLLINKSLKYLYFFTQYLVRYNKSLYTADMELLKDFEKYLLNYEFEPGNYYNLSTQLNIIRSIKRFYDWFIFEKYNDNHPLKDFKTAEFIDYIKKNKKTSVKEKPEINWYDHLLEGFIKYEEYKGFHKDTLKSHIKGCKFYFNYLKKVGISDINDITKDNIRNYFSYLNEQKNGSGESLSSNVKIRYIASIKSFYMYLEKYDLIDKLISNAIEYPKAEGGLPTNALKNKEINKLIELANGKDDKSVRDRTFFEVLYSSGIRSNELCQLKIRHIDTEAGTIRVDVPKGGKKYERVVPIGQKACMWINKYKSQVRSKLPKSEYLFVNMYGKPFSTSTILSAVKNYLRKTSFKNKKIVTHSFRVSCGTEMLKSGANIKLVQEQLGHTKITSTEKYIRLVPNDLKKAHKKFHPRG